MKAQFKNAVISFLSAGHYQNTIPPFPCVPRSDTGTYSVDELKDGVLVC